MCVCERVCVSERERECVCEREREGVSVREREGRERHRHRRTLSVCVRESAKETD